MQKTFTIIMFFLLCFMGKTVAQELRLGASVKHKMNKKLAGEFMVQQRYAEQNWLSAKSFVSQANIKYKWNKNVDYALGIRYHNIQNNKAEITFDKADKYRLTGDVKFKIPEHIKKLSIYNRVRMQYASNQNLKQNYTLRNRFELNYKYSKYLSNAISYELFYNVNKHKLAQHRVKFEVEYDITKRISLEGFFMIDGEQGKHGYRRNYIDGFGLCIKL